MVASDAVATTVDAPHRGDGVLDRVKPPTYRDIPCSRVLVILGMIVLDRSRRADGRSQENVVHDWMLYGVVVVGFYVVFGISGQFAFSQAALFGLGAYVS